jgi:hypothetical protein
VVLVYGMAFNLLLKLLFDEAPDQEKWSPPPPAVQVQAVRVSAQIELPKWINEVPEGCFVGISKPCESIGGAREMALESVVTQILQTMGAEYSFSYESTLSGTAHRSEYRLGECLTYSARWFVHAVQQNVKKSHIRQLMDKYFCFLLVEFPQAQINRLRKLTIGPKVGARIVRETDEHFVIQVTENNGVYVTLTDYEMDMITKNHYATIITMLAWKVPEAVQQRHKGVFQSKITIKGSSEEVEIPVRASRTNLRSLLLGSETEINVVLKGYDEVGRQISLSADSF